MNRQVKYKSFPRKAKKAIKRNFMRTIDSAWKSKEVKIKSLRIVSLKDKPDYKSWTVCSYMLGVIRNYKTLTPPNKQ